MLPNERHSHAGDLDSLLGDLPEAEARELAALGSELSAARPAPPLPTRAQLRELVIRANPPARPARLWLLIASYTGSGVLLLLAIALALAGVGPLSS